MSASAVNDLPTSPGSARDTTSLTPTEESHEPPTDHWTTVPALIPQVQPAALVIKMGFNRVFQYQPVTHYVFSMKCPATHTWWVLRKRYSEYHAMRTSLLRLHKTLARDASFAKITRLLQKALELTFPRKYLRDDDDDIKAERLVGLRMFASLLVAIRLSCMVLALQVDTPPSMFVYFINHIYNNLSEFLQVPEPQVHQELHHVIGKVSPHISATVTRPTTVLADDRGANQVIDVVCAICLDGVDDSQELVELVQCGHTFHKDCAGSWLKDHCTCPLCRTMSFDEESMVEYVTQLVLTKSRNDLLYQLNKARLQFAPFLQKDAVKTLRPLPHHARHESFHDLVDHATCAVCMDVFDHEHLQEVLQLECGHSFHHRCIYGWLGDHTTCPICRRLSHYGLLPPSPA